MRRDPLVIVLLLASAALGCAGLGDGGSFRSEPGMARGIVFDDADRDGERSPGERGVEGVRVSNGRHVAVSDRLGRYELPLVDREDTIVFVIKPSGWAPPVDEQGLSRFYYIHKPAGSPPALEHPGVAPTGALPPSIDFALHRQAEPERFRVLVLADPQPYSAEQLDFFARDILPELAGSDAAFGVSLGDLVGDDLALFEPLNAAMGLLGIPWYNVLGNHDINYDASDDRGSDESFERVYGPATYAFAYSGVHFIVLDNVVYDPGSEAEGRGPGYAGGISPEQLQFVHGYLATLPADRRVVLLMHIPLVGEGGHQLPAVQREALFAVLAGHPHTLSFSGHTHLQAQHFLGAEAGNSGAPHHHLNLATASGSWWRGLPDELGIPHTTMRDGTPNGYAVATFEGLDYAVRFKAARRPADYQMNVYAPARVRAADARNTEVLVNVFAGSERSRVELRLTGAPETAKAGAASWIRLEQVERPDPAYAALWKRELDLLGEERASLPGPVPSTHLWSGHLPGDPAPGSYWIEVRSTDLFDQVDTGRRLIRVDP